MDRFFAGLPVSPTCRFLPRSVSALLYHIHKNLSSAFWERFAKEKNLESPAS